MLDINNQIDNKPLISLNDIISSSKIPKTEIFSNINQPQSITLTTLNIDQTQSRDNSFSTPLQSSSLLSINELSDIDGGLDNNLLLPSVSNYSSVIQIPKRGEENQNQSISSDSFKNTISSTDEPNTLNESITQTILRDLTLIYRKITFVVSPWTKKEEKYRHIIQWDLWGPLLLSTLLACTLAWNAEGKSGMICLIYALFWMGGFLVFLNSYLLSQKAHFFQIMCLLGYSLFPLNISAIILALINFYEIIRFVIVVGSCFWSLYSFREFFKRVDYGEQEYLAVYPGVLLYVFISWVIFVSK